MLRISASVAPAKSPDRPAGVELIWGVALPRPGHLFRTSGTRL